MNVTVLSYYYLPDYSGGAKQWAGVMEQMKDDFEINFTVIAARTSPSHPKLEMINGINITRVDVGDTGNLFSFWYQATMEIWKNRESIDLVHANGLKMEHGFPLWFSHCLGKPTVGRLSIANSDISFSTQGRLLGRFHKWCLGRVDKYVAISTALVREVGDVGLSMDKCVLLYNGVNINIYLPSTEKEKECVRRKHGWGGETIVLFVGVMDKRKGVDVLIRAFHRVLNARSSTRLVLVGPANREDSGGKYVIGLKRQVHELGISEKVAFRDCTEEIIQYYQAADLLVLPSREEGMPNVVLEAMACSLPIVGSRISGTEDLIEQEESGLLVEVGDEVALAEAIIKLIDNPRIRHDMGEKALEKINKQHNMRAVSISYFRLYQQLLS